MTIVIEGMVFFLMLWVSPLMLPAFSYANGFCPYANRAFPYANRAFPYAHVAFPYAPTWLFLMLPCCTLRHNWLFLMLPPPPSFPPTVGLPCCALPQLHPSSFLELAFLIKNSKEN